jgi:hypothetical protein
MLLRSATRVFSFGLLLGTHLSAQDVAKHPDFGDVPLHFEENKGQTDASARYIARSASGVGFVLQNGWTLSLGGQPISMHIADADSKATLVPEGSVEGITNYYLGSRAITNLPHYSSVRSKDIRPGIDVVYHGNERELEYDLVIRPGADVDALRLRFEGSQPVLADNGDIILKTIAGEVRQHKPRVWQEAEGHRTEVECRYALLESGEVGFVLSNYDRSAELVVDPIISYSTYLGGTNDDRLAGIAVDGSGYAYLAGSTYSSDFPATSGTFQGNQEVFVAKLNPSGTGLVYFTFIGGRSNDFPGGIAIDNAGNAYVTGSTSSIDFPVTVNYFTSGQHAFVLKLDSTGNIVYSTALAGNGVDAGSAIAVDASGSAYVAGNTTSTHFPVTAGSFQLTPGGLGDAFVAKLSSTGQIAYATYLGGSGNDFAEAIAVDASGNAFVGGDTSSTNFPATPGAYSTGLRGLFSNAFIVKLNPAGSSLVYATYLGGSSVDFIRGLAVDSAGNCYVTGFTDSSNFPTTPGAFQRSWSGRYAGFVTKLNPTGTSLVYSTLLGGTHSYYSASGDSSVAIAVDLSGSAYVAGNSQPSGFPVTPGALKTMPVFLPCCEDDDMFLVKLAADGRSLLYSTLLGSTGIEVANAVAIDGIGGVYIAGLSTAPFSGAPVYPTSAGAYKTTIPNTQGAMVVTKIDLSSPALCFPSISPPSQSVPIYGGPFSFNLTLSPGCPWEAVELGSTALAFDGPRSGVVSTSPMSITGNVVGYPAPEQVSINIGTAMFTIVKNAGSCAQPFIAPQSVTIASGGGSTQIKLALPASCAWTAASGAPWLIVSQNPSGVGPATIGISAGANNFPPRSTTLTIAGKTIGVTQSAATPAFSVSHTSLNFNTGFNGIATSPQTVTVNFIGSAGGAWTATSNRPNIVVLQGSGTGNGSFQVSAGSGPNGIVTVTAPGFVGSPKQIQVSISNAPLGNPFGSFDTPADNTSGVAGALPVTGWALDAVEVVKVDIWREPVAGELAGALILIGDAVFVEGARPDVEALNPNLPFNYRAGWGYQILTNFLPNGNGTFKLHAIAQNKSGNSTDLGTKTITVDNAHASKPFGTIDTPTQGGTASGNAYVNFAWALTQNPNKIPIDGSTISVVIDGQPVGHPTYNQFRSDIASLFPGYMNSNGALGFFYIDTTMLTNGVHTISWNVSDNAGHGDGIGSRYFNVFNTGNGSQQPLPDSRGSEEETRNQALQTRNRAATVRERSPSTIEIEEVGRIELPLGAISGYQLVNGEHRPLPIGSSLNRGVFYWQPGPGFLGQYHLVFEHRDGAESHLHVRIRAKTYPQRIISIGPPHVQN